MRSLLLLSFFTLVFASAANATSVSYLYGDNFRDDLGYRPNKTTLTIENFALWEYGNVFYYYDITEPMGHDYGQHNNGKGSNYYSNQFFGGIAPTFSLSKMFGINFGNGFLRDVSIRTELENGSGNGYAAFQNYFYGLQYDVSIPGFDFFSFNTVVRDNPKVHGVGFQLGMFWQMSWDYGRWAKFKFTGFLATSPWDGNNKKFGENNYHGFDLLDNHGRFLTTQPQFLWDIGYGLTGKPNRIETGIEYAYFINRFQFAGRNESAPQAMVKVSY